MSANLETLGRFTPEGIRQFLEARQQYEVRVAEVLPRAQELLEWLKNPSVREVLAATDPNHSVDAEILLGSAIRSDLPSLAHYGENVVALDSTPVEYVFLIIKRDLQTKGAKPFPGQTWQVKGLINARIPEDITRSPNHANFEVIESLYKGYRWRRILSKDGKFYYYKGTRDLTAELLATSHPQIVNAVYDLIASRIIPAIPAISSPEQK